VCSADVGHCCDDTTGEPCAACAACMLAIQACCCCNKARGMGGNVAVSAMAVLGASPCPGGGSGTFLLSTETMNAAEHARVRSDGVEPGNAGGSGR